MNIGAVFTGLSELSEKQEVWRWVVFGRLWGSWRREMGP